MTFKIYFIYEHCNFEIKSVKDKNTSAVDQIDLFIKINNLKRFQIFHRRHFLIG